MEVPTSVGIRELRQNLSRHLRRVAAGEQLVVTERGRPVAVLSPWVDEEDPFERMVREGRATRGIGNPLDVEPIEGPVSDVASRAVLEMREERLY